MRLAVFFMSLCFLLWRGNTHMFTASADVDHYTHHSHKPHKVKFTGQDYSFFADTESDTEEEHIAHDDDGDNDLFEDLLSQPFRLLAMCYASAPYQSILTYHHNFYNDPPSFPGQLSHKYILQGVLRI